MRAVAWRQARAAQCQVQCLQAWHVLDKQASKPNRFRARLVGQALQSRSAILAYRGRRLLTHHQHGHAMKASDSRGVRLTRQGLATDKRRADSDLIALQ